MSLGETASSTSCSDCNQAFQELNTFFHVLLLLSYYLILEIQSLSIRE